MNGAETTLLASREYHLPTLTPLTQSHRCVSGDAYLPCAERGKRGVNVRRFYERL